MKIGFYILGVVLVLVGILGFISNPIVGDSSGVIFGTNLLHNLVHIISGILALYFAGKASAGMFAKVFGAIYLILGILGFVIADTLTNLLMVNMADNYLHLLLGIVFLALGFMGAKKAAPMSMPPAQPMS